MQGHLNFQVNHQDRQADCSPGTSLLSLLRNLGYAGVHRVCESGDCGSCTVWLDDKPIHSYICPAMRADGHQITTIEGLGNGKLSPMQQAFLNKQGFQCGYCTPGMIMTASKLKCPQKPNSGQSWKETFVAAPGMNPSLIAYLTVTKIVHRQ